MYQTDLVQKINLGLATPGQLREYVRRVARRKFPDRCTNGHDSCALFEGGPCCNECLLLAAKLDVEEVKAAPAEVKKRDPEVKTRGSSIWL